MKKEISNATLATQLFAIQEEKAALELREEAIKESLLLAMKTQGVRHVRLDNGTSFIRSYRETLKSVYEARAYEWAEKNNCLKTEIDTTKALKILRRDLKGLPKFFKRVKGNEYLTVKRVGQK